MAAAEQNSIVDRTFRRVSSQGSTARRLNQARQTNMMMHLEADLLLPHEGKMAGPHDAVLPSSV
jgi:hypothetical protein